MARSAIAERINFKTFIFADVPDAVLQEFYAGAATVSARRLFDSYRTMLAIVRLPEGM